MTFLYKIVTALIPHTTVVFPILTIEEPFAFVIEPAFITTGRNNSNSLPSGRIPYDK